MMGRSHALSAWCVGLAVAPLLGVDQPAAVVLFAATTAGWALAPDLDHPGSTASRWLGPVTGSVSRGLRALSAIVYEGTRGPRDGRSAGTHRHLTHTVLFAVAVGTLTAVGTAVSPWWGVLCPLAVGTLLAAQSLGDWVLLAGTVPVAWGLLGGDSLPVLLSPVQGWVGIAAALGCFVHCLGDAITKAACPFLWPRMIRGERWFEIGPPRWMRFTAGGKVEKRLVFPAFAVLAVLLVPGVWPAAVSSAIQVVAAH